MSFAGLPYAGGWRPKCGGTGFFSSRRNVVVGLAAMGAYIDVMFGDFLKRLTQPEPTPLDDEDARLALTALLVRVARSDGVYATAEIRRIDRIIADRYGLSPFETAELRGEAEVLETEAPDTVRFTRAIKDAVPYEDRRAVVQSLWTVVLADGERAKEEDALLRLVTNLLGVSDVDGAKARQKAARL